MTGQAIDLRSANERLLAKVQSLEATNRRHEHALDRLTTLVFSLRREVARLQGPAARVQRRNE